MEACERGEKSGLLEGQFEFAALAVGGFLIRRSMGLSLAFPAQPLSLQRHDPVVVFLIDGGKLQFASEEHSFQFDKGNGFQDLRQHSKLGIKMGHLKLDFDDFPG